MKDQKRMKSRPDYVRLGMIELKYLVVLFKIVEWFSLPFV